MESADQLGVKKAFKPSAEPSRNRARITTMTKSTVRMGIKIFDAFPMPESTPMASTMIEAIHTTARAIKMGHTNSVDSTWVASWWRNSFWKYCSGWSPQARVIDLMV